MRNKDYSPSLESAIKLARALAVQDKHSTFGVPHLVVAMFTENTGLKDILSSMQKDVSYIMEWFETHREMYKSDGTPTDDVSPDEELAKVLDESERSKIKLGTDLIDSICVFAAISREGVVYSRQQIESLGISEDDILQHYDALEPLHSYQGEEMQVTASVPYADNLKTPEILERATMVVGREKEVRTILECLERSENKGLLIIGEPGVGRSSIITSFVSAVCHNEDELLQQTSIVALNTAKLLASTSSEAEVAQKVVNLIYKMNKLERAVLVIDDLQVLLDNAPSGKSSVLVNILNAKISEGTVNIVMTITSDSYRKNIEKHTIEGRLDILKIDELDGTVLECAIQTHKQRIEQYYELALSGSCIKDSIALSKRYFKERCLPSIAIDLLDRTAAAVRLSNKNALNILKGIEAEFDRLINSEGEPNESSLYMIYLTIMTKMGVILTSKVSNNYQWNPDDSIAKKIDYLAELIHELGILAEQSVNEISKSEIEAIVADSTGIPIGKIQAREKDRLLSIEEKLRERVKGQDRAIATLSDAIIESRSGLSDPKKPIGSFFFLGPTGTGKTELTKTLAELLFDDESAMIRFDMSEFKEEHSAALLYGAPPGYVGYEEGGLLVNQIRQKPYSVVLFDEIEKAHNSVYDVFLQMMDEGKIHDRLGREGDFSNSIIIFTSNIGSQWIVDQIQSGKTPDSGRLIEVMAQYFRPEFLGRLTEVVPFSPIDEHVAKQIFNLHFGRLQDQLIKQKNITLRLSEEALLHLVKKGFSPKYGARPIAGVIRTYIKKNVSRLIVSEDIKPGDCIVINYRDGELIWEQC